MKLRNIISNPPDDYFTRLAKIESGNNPLAKAKTSTAAGLYQFTEGTWKDMTERLGLDFSLEDRFDPEKSRQVVEGFTKQNERYLTRKLGRKPNNAELYLAHFSGMGGANKLLQALETDPNASVKDVFKENQINANKSVFLNKDGSYKKAVDIYNWAAKKFSIDDYKKSEPEVEEKPVERRRTIGEFQERKRDNIPSLANRPFNPTYASIPSGDEVKKDLSEEDIRRILQQENKQKEQKFIQDFFKQNTEQTQDNVNYPQEDIYSLYQIEDINKY